MAFRSMAQPFLFCVGKVKRKKGCSLPIWLKYFSHLLVVHNCYSTSCLGSLRLDEGINLPQWRRWPPNSSPGYHYHVIGASFLTNINHTPPRQRCLEVSTYHYPRPSLDNQETHGQRQDPSSPAFRDGEGELCALPFSTATLAFLALTLGRLGLCSELASSWKLCGEVAAHSCILSSALSPSHNSRTTHKNTLVIL